MSDQKQKTGSERHIPVFLLSLDRDVLREFFDSNGPLSVEDVYRILNESFRNETDHVKRKKVNVN